MQWNNWLMVWPSGGSPLAAPAPAADGNGDEAAMIGALFGAFVVIALLLWAGIWYVNVCLLFSYIDNWKQIGHGGRGPRLEEYILLTLILVVPQIRHNTTCDELMMEWNALIFIQKKSQQNCNKGHGPPGHHIWSSNGQLIILNWGSSKLPLGKELSSW